MTWFPLQAALKMSTLPGAIQATLDHLLDHINPWKDPSTGRSDPRRPQTLIVFESLAQLAADAGFSMVSVADHLKRLRGEKPLKPGLTVQVLKRATDPDTGKELRATHHQAARYELNPAALDALVDPERLAGFERRQHDHDHPYQLWRDWRTANSPPRPSDQTEPSQGISSLYSEDVKENGQDISSLYAEAGQGISCLTDRVQAAYTEFTPVFDRENQLTPFLPDSEPTLPKKNGEGRSRTTAKAKTKTRTKTPAPATLDLDDELRAWVRDHACQVDLRFEREKFLQHCRAHETKNVNWIEAFKGWLLEADRRVRAHGHRPGVGPDRVLEQRRAHRASEGPVDPPPDALPTPSPTPDAEPPEWTYVQGIYGKHRDCGEYHQLQAPCPARPAQTSPKFPLRWWGINSTLLDKHQLDEPLEPHCCRRRPSMRQNQGLQIRGVTLV